MFKNKHFLGLMGLYRPRKCSVHNPIRSKIRKFNAESHYAESRFVLCRIP